MKLFTAAIQLVVDAERRQLRAINFRYSWVRWLLTEIWYPLVYVIHGLDFLIQNFWKSLFYVSIFTISAFIVSSIFDVPTNQTHANVIVSGVFGLFTVLFALPSTFSHLHLKEKDLDYLTERIQGLVTTKDALQNLITDLSLMEASVTDRVNALRWTLASVWALFLFGFNQSLGLILKFEQGERIGEIIGNSIMTFFMALIVVLIPILAIAGYRRANNLVFKGLAYACADELVKYEAKDIGQGLRQENRSDRRRSQFGRRLKT